MGVMYIVLILFNIFHVVYPRCQTLNSQSHGILIPNYKDPGNDECLNNIVFGKPSNHNITKKISTLLAA